MDIVRCDACKRAIIPMSDGRCPSCHIVLGAAAPPHQMPRGAGDPSLIGSDDPDHPPRPPTTPDPIRSARDRPAGVDDIILSIVVPLYGITLGILVAVVKGERKRGSTMIDIGLMVTALWIFGSVLVVICTTPHFLW